MTADPANPGGHMDWDPAETGDNAWERDRNAGVHAGAIVEMEIVEYDAGPRFAFSWSGKVVMRVTGATRDGTAHRWAYDLRRTTKATAGWSWAIDSGDATVYAGRNHAETINDQGGTVYGNGMPMADMPAGFDLLPVPTGRDVECTARRIGTTVEYWFDQDNMVSGECE